MPYFSHWLGDMGGEKFWRDSGWEVSEWVKWRWDGEVE